MTRKAGLKLGKDKCSFMVPSVIYLGHKIDAEGVHPVQDKIKAIQEASAPKTVNELKPYLGLLNYHKFFPKLFSEIAPLYALLRKDCKWKWTKLEQEAFQTSKDLLLSSQLLVHFDPTKEHILACDASGYGICAVLAHRMPDNSEKLIGYVSRILSTAEKNYSQMEKEALACVFGVKRFTHTY